MIISDLVIFICLILSAFFSGMEIAFVSANRIYLEIEKQQNGFNAKFLNFITKNPSRFIATMLVGNNISLVIYGIFMGDRILQLFFPETLLGGAISIHIVFIQTVISTIIILLTAEFLPKVFFQQFSNVLMKVFAIPTAFFYAFFFPITSMIIILSDYILIKFFKTKGDQVQLTFSKIELGNYIEEQLESTRDMDTVDSEIQIFQNALDFSEVKVREAMVPRTEIIATEITASLSDIKKLFTSSGLSKIPVFDDSIDDILGYIHVFEMFKKPTDLKKILLPVAFVPETMKISEVLKLLTKQRKSIAVVLDEYGGTSGIITVEDIIEELFGEIEDEHDHVALFEKQIDKGMFEFSARVEVDYINQKYDLSLPENEFYETLGGLIVYLKEEIPTEGTVIEIENYEFEIKEVSSTKIEKVILNVKDEL
ncbi:MAG: hemolysin family protein [Bacteroidota bacterium]|nr:hemolysin family protein [Bacteroidota bacterium]MEC9195056.1 hemolysin family protein [Bacteroidota bacterium]MEE3085583.1 hemolysin family protein [Bacteroidota bacterium]